MESSLLSDRETCGEGVGDFFYRYPYCLWPREKDIADNLEDYWKCVASYGPWESN